MIGRDSRDAALQKIADHTLADEAEATADEEFHISPGSIGKSKTPTQFAATQAGNILSSTMIVFSEGDQAAIDTNGLTGDALSIGRQV